MYKYLPPPSNIYRLKGLTTWSHWSYWSSRRAYINSRVKAVGILSILRLRRPGWRVVATYKSLVMHRQNRYTVLSNAGHRQRGDVIERYTRGRGSSKTPEFFRDHNAVGLTPDTDSPPGWPCNAVFPRGFFPRSLLVPFVAVSSRFPYVLHISASPRCPYVRSRCCGRLPLGRAWSRLIGLTQKSGSGHSAQSPIAKGLIIKSEAPKSDIVEPLAGDIALLLLP